MASALSRSCRFPRQGPRDVAVGNQHITVDPVALYQAAKHMVPRPLADDPGHDHADLLAAQARAADRLLAAGGARRHIEDLVLLGDAGLPRAAVLGQLASPGATGARPDH